MRKFLKKDTLKETLMPGMNKIWGMTNQSHSLYWISYENISRDEEQTYKTTTHVIDEKTKRIEYDCHRVVIINTGMNNKMTGNPNNLHGDCLDLYGDCSGLEGNCSDLKGDCTGIKGDCNYISGNFDCCWITDEERENGIHINDLINSFTLKISKNTEETL